MSQRHPIIAITGSSGAGTTSVTRTFDNIFRRENITAAIIEGDSFHRYDRKEMTQRQAEAEGQGNRNFSHFSAENNLFAELEALFRSYSETGNGKRASLHAKCAVADGERLLVSSANLTDHALAFIERRLHHLERFEMRQESRDGRPQIMRQVREHFATSAVDRLELRHLRLDSRCQVLEQCFETVDFVSAAPQLGCEFFELDIRKPADVGGLVHRVENAGHTRPHHCWSWYQYT